jgi:tetratricopeptide (TPR) repeat protein
MYDLSIKEFDKVLELDSNFVLALYNKSLALKFLEKNTEALEYLDRILEIDPEYIDAKIEKELITKLG